MPPSAPTLEQLPPGANTHFSLLPTFSHIIGVAIVPDNDPIFVQLPPTEAEGLCASVGVGIATTKRVAIHAALAEVLKVLNQNCLLLFATAFSKRQLELPHKSPSHTDSVSCPCTDNHISLNTHKSANLVHVTI